MCKRHVCLYTLRWRHNGRDSVSNHQPHDCWLDRLFRHRSKKTSKLRVTGLCVGNSPGTGEFPAQMASNAENVSIWWRHHDTYQHIKTSWTGNTFCITDPFCWDLIVFIHVLSHLLNAVCYLWKRNLRLAQHVTQFIHFRKWILNEQYAI